MTKTNELLKLYEEVVLKSIQSINSITVRVEKLAQAQNVFDQCFSRIERKINLIDIENGHSNLEVRNTCAKIQGRFDSLQKKYQNLCIEFSKIIKQDDPDNSITQFQENEPTIEDRVQKRKPKISWTASPQPVMKNPITKIEAFSANLPQCYKMDDLLKENQRIGRQYQNIVSQIVATNEKMFQKFNLKIKDIKQELISFLQRQEEVCKVVKVVKETEKQQRCEQIQQRDDQVKDDRNELQNKTQTDTVALLLNRTAVLQSQMPKKANKDETKRALIFLENKLNSLIADLPKQPQQIVSKEVEQSKKKVSVNFKEHLQIEQAKMLKKSTSSGKKCDSLSGVTTERQFQRLRKQARTYRSEAANFKQMSESVYYW